MSDLTTSKGEPLPAPIAGLVRAVADFLDVPVADLFVADHTHELLPPGSYSVAYEGAYDWPFRYVNAVYVGTRPGAAGYWLECGAGWLLIAYPVTD